MPLGLGSALWACILPVAKTNLLQNPSFERGDSLTSALTGGVTAVGTSSAYQQFGAWSLQVVPNAVGTSGVYVGTWSSGNGTPYTASAYVRGSFGGNYTMEVSDFTTKAIIGSVDFTGGGTWQRYSMSYTETGDTVRRHVIRNRGANDGGTYWIDGCQIEVGSITTFISGDDGGGTWNGAPHASTSTRPGQYRGGGSVVALADLGLSVDQMPGAGVPPIEVSIQSYAVIDGAQFQRQRAAPRQFSLTVKPLFGTTLADFHITRRTLWDAFKPDAVTPQQPVTFLYVGAQGTQQINAYYQSGLELGNMDGPIAETLGVSFVATDPYWYAPTQQGTTLRPRTNLGSVNFIAKRSPDGVWGTLGSNGTTVQAGVGAVSVHALAMNSGGTLFFGGRWGSLAGTTYPNAGMYYPQSNTFGTLTGGTIGNGAGAGTIRTIAFSPTGTAYIGGFFNTAGGTALAGVVQWNGAYGSLTGGTLGYLNSDQVWSLLYHPNGTLFMGGSITSVDGTTARHLVMWSNGVGGTLTGGTVDNQIYSVTRGFNNRVYFGGTFTSVGGTTARSVGFWNGAFGTLTGGTVNHLVFSVATGPNGYEYIGGLFTTLNGASALRALQWNGVQYATMGQQLTNDVYDLSVDQSDNTVYAVGNFGSTSSYALNGGFAKFIGNAWLPMDIDLNTFAGTVYTMLQTGDRTFYIAGRFFGTAAAASIGTMVNVGRSQAYPTLRLRNNSAGTAQLYQIVNTTTGDGIYFNYQMLAGEMATLVLEPGNRSFTSDFQGNVFGKILPGSNLATWSLLPGINTVSFLADNDSLEVSLFWSPRGWSIDSGTIR